MSILVEKRRGPLASLHESQSMHWSIRKDVHGYEKLAARLRTLIGVDMPPTEKNRTLMACRLAPLMRRHRCENYGQYDALLQRGRQEVVREFISTLTTHTTDFFRESQHFRFFPYILRDIETRKLRAGRPEIRVWCAAASTGQEAFTMLISILESGTRAGSWALKFLASDIDRAALVKASIGRYSVDEMAKVPGAVRERYFDLHRGAVGNSYRVKEKFRRLITFAEFNLSTNKYPFQHEFDVVFCRNVLIYFATQSGIRVVDHIVDHMASGGYLFVGHSETGFVKNRKLLTVAPAVFQKL